MDSVLQSLLWKEWRERRRTFFVCLAWILCGVVYVVLYESALGYRTPVSRFGSICLVYGLFMAVFFAMRVALSEVSNGTLDFSSVLPISLTRIAAVRLGFALISLIAPVLLGGLILTILLALGIMEQIPARLDSANSGFDISNRPSLSSIAAISLLGKVTCVSAAQTMGLFLVLSVIGARRRYEAHIGFLGAVIAFLWFFMMIAREMLRSFQSPLLQNWIGTLFPQSMVMYFSYSDANGSYNDLDLAGRIWLPLLLNLLILFGMAVWFTRRYGTQNAVVSVRKRRRWHCPPFFSWISFPHERQSVSLIWINLRQAVPIALAGLALACVMSLATVLSMSPFDSSVDQMHGKNTLTLVAYNLPASTWVIASLWATIVGSGIFAAELAPRLGHFWMSRPISLNRWFWFKYFVGMFVVLLVLDGSTIAVSWNSMDIPASQVTNYETNHLSWSYIVCYPVLHALLYSLAVLAVCYFKKPVRGAAVSFALFLVVSIVLESIPVVADYDLLYVYNNLFMAERKGEFNLANHHFPLVYGTLFVITIFTAYLASRKVQRLEV